ncbi:MAG: RND family transporter [Halioglobus sp.]
MLSKALQYVLAYRNWVVALWLVLLTASAYWLTEIRVSYDTRAFFDSADTNLLRFKAFETTYTKADSVLFLVRRVDDASMANPTAFSHLTQLADSIWKLPHISRLDSLINYKQAAGNSDSLGIENFITNERLSSGGPWQRDVQAIAADDPTVFGRLVSNDLSTMALWASVQLPDQADSAVAEIDAAASLLATEFEQAHPEYKVFVGGMVPLMAAFAAAALSDFKLLVPISLATSGLLILLFLRHWQSAAALLCVVSTTALVSVGAATLWGHIFNTATVILPIVVAVLVLAAGLHVVFSIASISGPASDQAVRISEGLSSVAKPSVLALATTAIGFLSFNFADAPPLRELGNLVIFGLVVGYALLFTLLPCLLSWTNWTPTLGGESLIQRISRLFTTPNYRPIIVASVFAVVSIPGLLVLKIDDNFVEYFDTGFSYRQAADATSQYLGSVNLIELDLVHPNHDRITDPTYLSEVRAIGTWLRNRSEVSYAFGYADAIQQVAKSIPERGGALPVDRAGIGEYLFLYELSLENGEALTDFISADQTASRMQVALKNLSSAEIRQFLTAFKGFVSQRDFFDDQSDSTGLTKLFASLTVNNVASMMWATVFSMIIISIIIGIVLGRLWLVFVCLIVTLLPLLSAFGIWGWLQGTLGLPGAVVIALTIGIVIDDTVHFLHRYELSRKRMVVSEAIAAAFHTAGRPMLFTTLSLIVGFLLLSGSGFQINAHLGVFAALIFALALGACFCFLPGLLKMVEGRSVD